MKTLFINPSVRPDSDKKIPNVGLAYVMTEAARRGLSFDLIDIDAYRYSDAQLRALLAARTFDIAAIGTLVSMYGTVKRIAGMVRELHPKAVIVVGNTLGTSISKLVLEKTDIDVCVIGEGEATYVDLVRALESGRPLASVNGIAYRDGGRVVETAPRDLLDIDAIPFPDYGLFDMKVYLEASRRHVPAAEKLPYRYEDLVAMPVNTARGCPFRCNFCYHAFQLRNYRVRSADGIVAEFKHWKAKYGINFVNCWDELTFASPQQAERFADLMIAEDLGIHWVASVRSELLVRKEGGLRIATKLKKANCHGLAFSLESGNPEILEAMNKKNTVVEFVEQCKLLHEAGVDIYTSLIIGYPQETPRTIDDSFRLMREAKLYPSVGFLQLMPGTPMYQLGRDSGAIPDEEDYLLRMGDRQDLRINLTKYDDKFLMDYTTQKLKELNAELKMGLDDSALIKTKSWRGKGKAVRKDDFMQDFGVAAEVLRSGNFS